jgi:hypothetical protein
MADPRPITREELARFLPNQRAIRAFEKLFDLIPDDLESSAALIVELTNEISNVQGKANAALSLVPEQRLASVVSSDYTTANSEKVACSNSVTITLNDTPDDFELVTIVATNGKVNIEGNGRDISGHPSVVISRNYNSLSLMYSIELNEWLIQ